MSSATPAIVNDGVKLSKQKDMLPKGCKGEELKKASLDIGNRLFPSFKTVKHPDRDGLLIAEWARRKGL